MSNSSDEHGIGVADEKLHRNLVGFLFAIHVIILRNYNMIPEGSLGNILFGVELDSSHMNCKQIEIENELQNEDQIKHIIDLCESY